jgi:glyoxylase-like metal-dependent hydrolase (beta-lactamase superfamily II)/rhodanese-related sulfurtransferase
MSGPAVVPIIDAGLGNSAYLVDLGEGRALVVDASIDLRGVRSVAGAGGLTVAYAAETHLHADFVSGARQLAHTDGATVLASTAGGRQFDHAGLRDGDEVDLGGLRLRALATAGHTDEHIALLLLDGGREVGVFTGGSLLVGSTARTDLVDPARTDELARAQYRSMRRLSALPDETAVWPTHGAGSFCSAPVGAERTSSIGKEKASNAYLQVDSEDEFVRRLVGSLGSYPPYFTRLPEVNRRGPRPVTEAPGLTSIDASRVGHLVRGGAWLVDTRTVGKYAARHVVGALSNPLREAFATWLGWVVPAGAPVIVLRSEDQDPEEIVWQSRKVGCDTVLGELAGGIDAATNAGLATRGTRLLVSADVPEATVIDVRQPDEFDAGHVPGALLRPLGGAGLALDTLPDGPIATMCGHGERAATAASLLERAGRLDVAVMVGGPDDWADGGDGAREPSK